MRAKELERLLSAKLQRDPSDLDLRGRMLRAANLVESGPRGRHAPSISPAMCAAIVIGTAGARLATEAAEAALIFGRLVPIGGPPKSYCGAETFIDALADILGDSRTAGAIQHVSLRLPAKLKGRSPNDLRDFPIAIIEWTGAKGETCRAMFTTKFVAQHFAPKHGLAEFQRQGLNACSVGVDEHVRIDGEFIESLAEGLDPLGGGRETE